MKSPEMSPSRFWQFIETALSESEGDLDQEVKSLTDQLTGLSPDDILQFQKAWDQTAALADRWELRAASHLINGDSDEDTFTEFRAWLIAQGRKVFEEVLDDPESLTDLVESEPRCRAILKAPAIAYKSRTKSSMPAQPPIEVETAGEEWIEADLPELFPKLWEQFGDDDGED